MTEKEIITEFVNSDSFPIIHNYVSRPYEETINEMQQDKDNLIKYLEDKIYSIQPKGTYINFFPADGYDSEEDMIKAIVEYNVLEELQDILERLKSGKYE